jgi:hypothetical protein
MATAAICGALALTVTAHPDFDDTPLWDDNRDGDYNNDGRLWHAHWVEVGPDERVPSKLAVFAVAKELATEVLPPAEPTFKFDAVTAYLQVKASDPQRPMLGVSDVYVILSGDISLPFSVA